MRACRACMDFKDGGEVDRSSSAAASSVSQQCFEEMFILSKELFELVSCLGSWKGDAAPAESSGFV